MATWPLYILEFPYNQVSSTKSTGPPEHAGKGGSFSVSTADTDN